MLSRTQAKPDRTVKEEQEEISRNHVPTIIHFPVFNLARYHPFFIWLIPITTVYSLDRFIPPFLTMETVKMVELRRCSRYVLAQMPWPRIQLRAPDTVQSGWASLGVSSFGFPFETNFNQTDDHVFVDEKKRRKLPVLLAFACRTGG